MWETLPATPAVPDSTGPSQLINSVAQTAVMSVLSRMGSNVAAVELDKLLAFQDDEPGFTSIRVKGCDGRQLRDPDTYAAEVELLSDEFNFPSELYYIIAFAFEGRCMDFVVISRGRLNELRLSKDIGIEHIDEATGRRYLRLRFLVSNRAVTCDAEPFDDYRNAWQSLPPLARRQA